MERKPVCILCLLAGSVAAIMVVGLLISAGVGRPIDRRVGSAAAQPPASAGNPLRLGLIPERDIFEQRARYRALADYLETKLERPVELVSLRCYDAILEDFRAGEIDGAFLGSLVAVLAIDRFDARVLLKPVGTDEVSTYCGVIFVREDSPVKSVADLAGRSLAMVRTTAAGHLFPMCVLHEAGLLDAGAERPRFHWSGTHDEAILDVAEGRVEAGAAKDLRLDALAFMRPELGLRRIACGERVPNNALLLRSELPDALGDRLRGIMLSMDETAEGMKALQAFGAQRFTACEASEYGEIFEMVERMGPAWAKLGIAGPPPTRPGHRETAGP
jgi:phosphonate transport system substrate-binding protein